MKLYDIFGIGGNSLGFGGAGSSIPALSDNGANVISTEGIIVPLGAVGTPSVAFAGNTNTGWWSSAGNGIFASVNSTRTWLINAQGMQVGSGIPIGWSPTSDAGSAISDTLFRRRAAANIALGVADVNGVPVAQTISVQNAITGSNLAGSIFTIDAPLGTGNAAGAGTKVNRALMKATGTTAQTASNALVVAESKTLSNTSATATSLATVSVPSNSGGGCSGFITIVADDGTNFDSETQSFNVSYVNKAGALTIGAPAITASTAASNSGSTTIGITIVAGTNAVDIKVTPVFTTIVPTTVTAYIEIFNHGTGNVTIN